MPEYSIVVPVHNEEESLPILFDEILRVMSSLRRPFEIIFIDDGSSDRSLLLLEGLKTGYPEVVKIISFKQRCGQTLALRKGLDKAQGNIVITMDADLQNDPEDILKLLDRLERGGDCICGWRRARQDTSLKSGLSKCGNILQRWLTGMKIHDVSCTLRVYRGECVSKIALNWEGQHRFIPLSLSLQGYKVDEIVSNHRKRRFGTTKYSHKRIFKVVFDFFRVLATGGKR